MKHGLANFSAVLPRP